MMIINEQNVSEVICLRCYKRWKAVRPVQTRLDELECPNCGYSGYAIETGETTTAEELLQMGTD